MTFEEAVQKVGRVEPSDDEIKNGWDVETLTIYIAEREMSAADTVLEPSPIKPTKTNHGLRWLR